MPNAPKEGSRAWERSLPQSPNYIRETIRSLTERAAATGNKQAADVLAAWLRRHPEMRETVRQLDDLCTQAEIAWVSALAGKDIVRERAVRDEIERMKGELLGEAPSPLDRVMVSNFIVAYLANQHAAIAAARPAEHSAVAAARDRRAESTQRRLLLAMKGMTLIREKVARGIAPRKKLMLFDATA
jgi:hypothetical protein